MIPVEPKRPHYGAARITFAKDQPEYTPLPACIDSSGLVLTEWEFTAEDLAAILNGGRLRLWVWTFRQPLQPMMLEAVGDEPGRRP